MVAIAADLSVRADALGLLIGGPHFLYVLLFGAFCLATQIFMRYTRYVLLLKWATLSLFAYFGAVLMVEVPWQDVIAAMLAPPLTFERSYLTTIVAIFGVALSPYLFFWQASQEVEDQRVKPKREPLVEAPEQAPAALERIGLDTCIGMAVANLVGLAIIITAGTTLHAEGVTEVQTSAQAAEALRPIAGTFAFAIFSIGIIGTGLLAIPVLAGSAAYAIGEARKWPVGLARGLLEAKAFYATVAVATLAGVAANLTGLNPIRALYWSAVVAGVVATPMLAIMMWLASQPRIMGAFTIEMPLKIGGWIATAVMAASVVAMGVTAVLEVAP
jgi:Mn2+/Fe2+ NRAMP family transporter